jgi:hypothetical protein
MNLCWPVIPLLSAKTPDTWQRASLPCTEDKTHGKEKHTANTNFVVHHTKTLRQKPSPLMLFFFDVYL